MHLQTHALASWLLAENWTRVDDASRSALVLLPVSAPDLDALSLIGGIGAYQEVHHLAFQMSGAPR